jgi:alkylation response protein AidB-like acyl-CoA dehydrogenase
MMDFRLTDDQEALRDGVRAFCEARFAAKRLDETARAGGFDRALWTELAGMGVFGLRLPERNGGVGLGMADAVLVFAELGRRLLPGPTVWSHLAAGLVDGAASGDAVVGGLEADPGAPWIVEHAASLDALLLLRADGVELIDPRALASEPIATPLDPLTPVGSVAALPAGEPVGGAELAARLRLDGAALVAAQLLGIAESTQEMATAYAKEREQFGRPIGAFQSIKHMLADMFVRQEVARAAVYAAGATLDDPAVGDAARAVASAKVVAFDAAMKNARACIQIHGGMGYTWEMPPHWYLKRTWALAGVFGDSEIHEEQLAAGIGGSLELRSASTSR